MKPTINQMGFFSIILLLFVCANVYVLWRLWHLVPPSAPTVRIVVLVCGIVLTLAFFGGMAARGTALPVWLTSLVYRIGTAWLFIFLYLLIAFVAGDLLRLVHLIPKGIVFDVAKDMVRCAHRDLHDRQHRLPQQTPCRNLA